jgi:hypothetical protein
VGSEPLNHWDKASYRLMQIYKGLPEQEKVVPHSSVFLPVHDRDGQVLARLVECAPQLPELFNRVFLSLTPATLEAHPGPVTRLCENGYFQVFTPQGPAEVGAHFHAFYSWAVAQVPPGSLVHLAFPDRLAFALLTEYAPEFRREIANLILEDTPLIYERSEQAWQTHPANYRELEAMVVRAGELLDGRRIDYAWCHMVVESCRLQEALKLTRQRNWAFVSELVLTLGPGVRTKEVDWLAWEDGFILGVEEGALKRQRENDPQETRKRMAYVGQMIQFLGTAESGD